jgi:hypothetical protein
MSLKFKLEISLLISAILLYVFSAFCYTYEASEAALDSSLDSPYRIYAFPLIALASTFLAVAAILYSRKK